MSDSPRLFCTFHLAGRLFGVDVRDVKEVNAETAFTRIPHAPPEVCGYANLRGQVYLVLDLRRLLGTGPGCVGPDNRLVIFKPAVGDSVGTLVDAIGDIVTLDEDSVEEYPAGGGAAGDLIGGVGKLDGQLLVILRARHLLRAVEAAVNG